MSSLVDALSLVITPAVAIAGTPSKYVYLLICGLSACVIACTLFLHFFMLVNGMLLMLVVCVGVFRVWR